jgi:hypothetical protein
LKSLLETDLAKAYNYEAEFAFAVRRRARMQKQEDNQQEKTRNTYILQRSLWDNRTRAAVLADAAQRFPPEKIDTIMAILDEYPRHKGFGTETDTETGIARVHLAILKLSHGDTAVLRQCVELANSDFRDVLVAAGDA